MPTLTRPTDGATRRRSTLKVQLAWVVNTRLNRTEGRSSTAAQRDKRHTRARREFPFDAAEAASHAAAELARQLQVFPATVTTDLHMHGGSRATGADDDIWWRPRLLEARERRDSTAEDACGQGDLGSSRPAGGPAVRSRRPSASCPPLRGGHEGAGQGLRHAGDTAVQNQMPWAQETR
jgi:hypothetical protein